jgi:hypothetical protein
VSGGAHELWAESSPETYELEKSLKAEVCVSAQTLAFCQVSLRDILLCSDRNFG